jgi:hypothetical protein
MGRLVLFFDSSGNGWDIVGERWKLVEAAWVDAEETERFTQKTAWAALSDEEIAEGEEWAREQVSALPVLFERLPVSPVSRPLALLAA